MCHLSIGQVFVHLQVKLCFYPSFDIFLIVSFFFYFLCQKHLKRKKKIAFPQAKYTQKITNTSMSRKLNILFIVKNCTLNSKKQQFSKLKPLPKLQLENVTRLVCFQQTQKELTFNYLDIKKKLGKKNPKFTIFLGND